jgi:hypothetical protein
MTTPQEQESGGWQALQEQMERGDSRFVEILRRNHDAAFLGELAGRWYELAGQSPVARRLLLEYLEGPLNAYRHEALVKRLFKRAEAAGDDEVMARFLVALDRSLRRVRRRRIQQQHSLAKDAEQAQALIRQWLAEGYERADFWVYENQYRVYGWWTETFITTPARTTLPKGGFGSRDRDNRTDRQPLWDRIIAAFRTDSTDPDSTDLRPEDTLSEAQQKRLAPLRLFSVPTRHYLRRRAWRYFRRLGRSAPERYVAAIVPALLRYEDADVADGLALLDNWGLVHALFHYSQAIEARPRGWRPAEGRSLAELKPTPIYEELWHNAPRALFDLLQQARCRTVRRWALQMLTRHADTDAARAAIGLDDILSLLRHADDEVVAFGVGLLRSAQGLETIDADRWLSLASSANPAALEALAELMAARIRPDQVSRFTAARLAASRPIPLARLGLSWLRELSDPLARSQSNHREQSALVALLLDAQAEPLRGEILSWLRSALAEPNDPQSRSETILTFLDSRYADARTVGLAWFREDSHARNNVSLWQKLLESPYDDVRFALAAHLDTQLDRDGGQVPAESRTQAVDRSSAGSSRLLALDQELDADRMRLLWASVLLNIVRGGRTKPIVVRQAADRLGRHPEEADRLVPLLGVALRSLRDTERKAALAALVRLIDHHPGTATLVLDAFPEIQLV